MAKSTDADGVYQLKITLKHTKPPIWRRVQLKDCHLGKLHDIIQSAMGWYDCHLHLFDVGGEQYGVPSEDDWSEVQDESRLRLSRVVNSGIKKFSYTYDFGDNWEHAIQVEKVLAPEAGAKYPLCIAGKRACPPEDCGGPWGYGSFLGAISNPGHEQHKEMLEWAGGAFDPEAFSVEAVNLRLR